MTLVQMRYFYEVCQWQNITKAAEHLHVSQPTVTVAMQALEAETGLNLFHREGRKITVTADGAKLLSKVSYILTEVARLDDEIRDMAHRHAKVRIAMPLQLGVVFLPHIFGEFRAEHPEIELEIIETGGVSALQMVEEEKLDFALTNYTADFSARLSYAKLFDCECTFVTRPDHPFAQRHTLSISDLKDEPLIMLDSKFFVDRLVQDAYGRAGRHPLLALPPHRQKPRARGHRIDLPRAPIRSPDGRLRPDPSDRPHLYQQRARHEKGAAGIR